MPFVAFTSIGIRFCAVHTKRSSPSCSQDTPKSAKAQPVYKKMSELYDKQNKTVLEWYSVRMLFLQKLK